MGSVGVGDRHVECCRCGQEGSLVSNVRIAWIVDIISILICSVTFGIRFGFGDGGTVASLTTAVRIVGMDIFVIVVRRCCMIRVRI